MLTAIETTAILASMEKAKSIIQEKAPKIYSKDLLEVIFQNVYCKIGFLEQAGIAKRQTAASYLQVLEGLGLLEVIKIGKENYYMNKSLLKILKS
ncbi:MAG: hypothetical protein A2103_03815 [Gammaproteobacteria bacterium GWF2_41_13]|nr:MAG: hypothetical protein A2103_03815 [Gammaproteobacteria bacterium GWF2_41_13]